MQSLDTLREFYGTIGFPTPPGGRLQTIAADLMDTDADLISDVTFDSIPRSDVGQGPLVQASASTAAFLLVTVLKIDHARLPIALVLW